MKRHKTPLSVLSFSFGILLSLYITGSISNAVVNGLHSFNSMIDDDYDRVRMKCPVIRSPSEGARVSVIFPKNTSDSPMLYSVTGRADYHISYREILPSEEALVPPGEELHISRVIGKAGSDPRYLVIRLRAQAGGRRPFPSTLREVAYEARCGMAIVNILGLNSLPILILTLGIHLTGFTLFKRHAYSRMPESAVLRSSTIILTLLAFIGPLLAMLPLYQTDFLLTVYSIIVYLILLLAIFLLIGLPFRKLLLWLRNRRNRRRQAS